MVGERNSPFYLFHLLEDHPEPLLHELLQTVHDIEVAIKTMNSLRTSWKH